jgi:hypothetical protein
MAFGLCARAFEKEKQIIAIGISRGVFDTVKSAFS